MKLKTVRQMKKSLNFLKEENGVIFFLSGDPFVPAIDGFLKGRELKSFQTDGDNIVYDNKMGLRVSKHAFKEQ